jgi:hypothetical protein
MGKENYKEFFGFILKKEELRSIENCEKCHSFILTASNPFPGYSQQIKKNFYYLIIDNEKQDINDYLIRVTQNINKIYNRKIEASPCVLTIYNKFYKAIRLYNHTLDEIPEIESYYKLYGISFLKKQIVKPFISLIKLHKYFELIENDKGLYMSRNSPEFYYVQIHDKLEWEEFEELISEIKNKGIYKNCDFSIAVFYSINGFDDLIRIYSDNCSLEKQKEFQTYILDSIKKITLK